jgi:spermidine synthase
LEEVFDRAVSAAPRIQEGSPAGTSILRILAVLFFLSGASSLVFETIFTRLLTYTFGNTAHATSTVLAAFLGGLALGAFLFGRWVDRRAPSLWIYGTLELLVGVYCIFIPQLFALLTRAYVALYHWFHLGPAALTATRFLLAAVVILIPTILMGGTLPALARVVSAGRRHFEADVSRLYAWNTLGAALGTLASTYALMPYWGVRATIGLACTINFIIFIAAAVLAARRSSSPFAGQDVPPELAVGRPPAPRLVTAVLLSGALLTGAVALAYEVIWTHVLAFLIGNTVYAFGVMLFTFLCGLGLGAQVVARRLRRPESWARALAASQMLLALAVFSTLPLWNRIPDVFARGLAKAFEFDFLSVVLLLLARMAWVGVKIRRLRATGFPKSAAAEFSMEALLLVGLMMASTARLWKFEATYFVTAELLRFFCAFYLLIVPATLLGLSFPLLLNLASHGSRRVGGSVGGIYAANTLGAILGSVLTGFVLLPHWGSLASLKTSAALNLLLGFAFAAALLKMTTARKLALAAAMVAVTMVAWTSMGNWDARRMSRGSYVYFDPGWPIDRVLYHAEDVEGGLTSVVEIGPTRVLLSNGKFQGNNSGEVGAQVRFALIPILFTREFDRALVIGLGTGSTLRTVASFPFRRIDTVEIAPHIVEAARRWFPDVNGRVFDHDPRVHLTIADGRNFLLLSRQRYDVITVEISSIWISGEADLYNKEFYELCRAHLKEHGVLQQWVQIHHMRTEDFLVILNTAAHVFPHVAFFLGPEQGVLIASAAPLECDYRRLESYDREPKVREELAALNIPSTFGLLGEMMLCGDSLRQALAQLPRFSGRPPDFVSTDFRPYLEYQTPKGNSLPRTTVYDNLNFMLALRPADPLPSDFPITHVPSEDERNLIRGYAATHRGDLPAAIEYFGRVRGAAQSRAREEIGMIEAGARGVERLR